MPQGHGTYYEDDGHIECEWQGGKANGPGRKVYPGSGRADGFGADVYEGMFKEDKRHGSGTMMYSSGDIYEGMWADDQKHGPGTFFYMSKGKRFDGVWQLDVPKCGAYSEIHTPPPGTNGSLPPIELAQPQGVLQAAMHQTMAGL